MALPLETGRIQDEWTRRALERIALLWPIDDIIHLVGATAEPAFQNAWVNLGAGFPVASFYRKGERVYLEGGIKTGTIGLVAFTLPAGYRPTTDNVNFATASAGAFGRAVVNSNGDVVPTTGSNVTFFLSGVSFRAA